MADIIGGEQTGSGAPRFCTECGEQLDSGTAFCTSCGARVEAPEPQPQPQPESEPQPQPAPEPASAPVTEPFPVPPDASPVPPSPVEPVSAQAKAPARRPHLRMALVIGAIALVAIGVVAAFFLLRPASSSQDPTGDTPISEPSEQGENPEKDLSFVVVDDTEEEEEPLVVELTQKCTTRFEDVAKVTYPAFTFKFPSNWTVTTSDVSATGERIVLENQDGVQIEYSMSMGSPEGGIQRSYEDVVVMADAAFVPGAVQGTSHADLGPFVVTAGRMAARGELAPTLCFALLPLSSVENGAQPLISHVPAFPYSSTLSFVCDPQTELDERTTIEVVSILASFEQAEGSASDVPAEEPEQGEDDYVLPDSAVRPYTEAELNSLTNYELYLARNEIFARHGREFQNEDLRSYFGSKSWYAPSVPASAFDQSVLSSVERANVELMLSIERSRGSSYLN